MVYSVLVPADLEYLYTRQQTRVRAGAGSCLPSMLPPGLHSLGTSPSPPPEYLRVLLLVLHTGT